MTNDSHTFDPSSVGRIDLARDGEESPLVVELDSFFQFSFWIAEELSDLVAENQHRNCGRLSADRHPGLATKSGCKKIR